MTGFDFVAEVLGPDAAPAIGAGRPQPSPPAPTPIPPEQIVAMRHEGALHVSFRPMPLRRAAADALRRRSTAERLRGGATICERTANSATADAEAPAGPCARPVAPVVAGSGLAR